MRFAATIISMTAPARPEAPPSRASSPAAAPMMKARMNIPIMRKYLTRTEICIDDFYPQRFSKPFGAGCLRDYRHG